MAQAGINSSCENCNNNKQILTYPNKNNQTNWTIEDLKKHFPNCSICSFNPFGFIKKNIQK